MKLSIVIIEYNSLDEVFSLMEDIKISFLNNYEVIISSNSLYQADKKELLVNQIPEAKWVFNNRNGGFAYGMNAGIGQTNGDLIFIFNPDVKLINVPIKEVCQLFKENPNIGAVGPAIIDKNGVVQDSCRKFIGISDPIVRTFRRMRAKDCVLLEKNIDYKKPQVVDWIIGSSMIFTPKVFNAIGGFDEGYFLYLEDVDFCRRLYGAGYKVYYFPKMIISYKGDRKSTSRTFSFNKYLLIHISSYLRYLTKYYFALPLGRLFSINKISRDGDHSWPK